ncbi:MAG: FecR domain-containing protein [Deltaproteobacteria bacterium]|nr:FecR domain-containing protein [Deltaproteobacteria bacterium]
MKPGTSSRRLLARLGASPVLVEERGRAAARRERVIARLHVLGLAEIGRRTGRARRLRFLALVAIAVTPAIALLVVWLAVRGAGSPGTSTAQGARVAALAGSVHVVHTGRGATAVSRDELAVGLADEVTTGPGAQARMTLASGAVLTVGPNAHLRLLPVAEHPHGRHERIELGLGRIDLDVPRLGPDASLGVQTVHALVLVRGTSFTAEVRPAGDGGGLASFVTVMQGEVVVRTDRLETRLGAAAHWSSWPQEAEPSPQVSEPDAAWSRPPGTRAGRQSGDPRAGAAAGGGPPAGPAAGGEARPASEPPDAGGPDATPATAGSAGPGASSGSTLAEQNQLFSAAMAARRRGDDAAAVAQLDELLRRFPESALAQDARVERARAMDRLGRTPGALH